MSFVHSKSTFFSLNGANLSTYTKASSWNRGADIHDLTTYGKDDHVNAGGLGVSSGSASGIYDNTVSSGPRAVLEPLVGQTVTLIRRPEGTGTGKPQDSVSVVIGTYVETSPVAGYVEWSVELTGSDAVTSTTQ